jgi:hypothetical protein
MTRPRPLDSDAMWRLVKENRGHECDRAIHRLWATSPPAIRSDVPCRVQVALLEQCLDSFLCALLNMVPREARRYHK